MGLYETYIKKGYKAKYMDKLFQTFILRKYNPGTNNYIHPRSVKKEYTKKMLTRSQADVDDDLQRIMEMIENKRERYYRTSLTRQ